MNDREKIANALRQLVAAIYSDCYGAYGVGDNGYGGEFDTEIQKLVDALVEEQ